MDGYTVIYTDNKLQCKETCPENKYRKSDGGCGECSDGKVPYTTSDVREAFDCVPSGESSETGEDTTGG